MKNKTCNICRQTKPISDFSFVKNRNRHMNYCKSCNNEKFKSYRKRKSYKDYRKKYQQTKKYKEVAKKCKRQGHAKKAHRERMRECRKMMKGEIMLHYGKGQIRCCKCGFDNIKALSIDHISGGGTKHRKALKVSGMQFYNWLRKNDYPAGFQVLCMNCQFIKRVDNKEHTRSIDSTPNTLPSCLHETSLKHPNKHEF